MSNAGRKRISVYVRSMTFPTRFTRDPLARKQALHRPRFLYGRADTSGCQAQRIPSALGCHRSNAISRHPYVQLSHVRINSSSQNTRIRGYASKHQPANAELGQQDGQWRGKEGRVLRLEDVVVVRAWRQTLHQRCGLPPASRHAPTRSPRWPCQWVKLSLA